MKATPGVRRRHSNTCPARDTNRRCTCSGGYEAYVYDRTTDRKIRRTFPTLAAARTWRADAEQGVRRGTLRASDPVSVNDAADHLLTGMASGAVRTRSGDRYKPSVIRGFTAAFDNRIRPDLGAMRVADVQRRHVQRLADRLLAENLSPSSVRNALMPLRVLYRRAIRDGLVTTNPTEQLDLPANRSRRVSIVGADQAARLITVIGDTSDRALWATAFYAGLRRGELMALRWRDVALANGELHVRDSYDPVERDFVGVKSRAGERRVPIAGALRDALLELRLDRADANPETLVFGRPDGRPFDYDPMIARTRAAWAAAGLEPVGLHTARHTAASVMIAAGVNVKALSEFLGHASITITLDRYGHLLPGSIAEAATLLDAYLDRSGAFSGASVANPLEIADSE